MTSAPNIVILGDYERALRRFSNWEKLEKHAHLTIHHEPLRDEALYEAVKDADAIAIVRDRSPFNEAMIARLPKLKFLMFTGERNGTLDAAALVARNIPIACTPGGPSKETTAELTWALILGASKRIIEENRLIASGGWRDTLSVSMHLVAGPGTKGLISADQLALMRPDSILINTSRAALINMTDLSEALVAGRPGQAAVDVFDIEPLPKDDPLRNTPNLLVTPHLGFIAEPIFATFAKGITDTLEAWLDNKTVPHPFKPQ